MDELVLRPYATALFEIAKEQDEIDEFTTEIIIVENAIKENTEFMEVLLHPKIPGEQKIEFIENIFKGKIKDEIVGTLVIILKKRRQDILLDVFELYMEMVAEYRGIVQATVTSAIELKEDQITQIKLNIEKKTNKTVEINATIDKSIIGGMIIRVGDSVLDASISGRLNKLKNNLVNLRLA